VSGVSLVCSVMEVTEQLFAVSQFVDLWLNTLPPTKEDINVFARVCLSVLSISKITQKRVHGFR